MEEALKNLLAEAKLETFRSHPNVYTTIATGEGGEGRILVSFVPERMITKVANPAENEGKAKLSVRAIGVVIRFAVDQPSRFPKLKEVFKIVKTGHMKDANDEPLSVYKLDKVEVPVAGWPCSQKEFMEKMATEDGYEKIGTWVEERVKKAGGTPIAVALSEVVASQFLELNTDDLVEFTLPLLDSEKPAVSDEVEFDHEGNALFSDSAPGAGGTIIDTEEEDPDDDPSY